MTNYLTLMQKQIILTKMVARHILLKELGTSSMALLASIVQGKR